jgi:hypothetical protein
VAREIDEAFIEEAVERYQRVDSLLSQFEKALRGVEVTVTSPDGFADGTIRDVTVTGSLAGRSNAQLSRSIRDAIAAAADAASWARAKLHAETFSGYASLGEG